MTLASRRRFTLLLTLSLALLAGFASTPVAIQQVAAKDSKKPDVVRGATEVMVPMRDGVKLATNVFKPKGEGPWPVIVTRTPYSKDGQFSALWPRYTAAGYVFVIQDTRGKFRSEGDYRPFETDRVDGFDTIEWVSQQDWCNGNVGMSGASAMGITSLAAACEKPPALKAAYVIVAPECFWNEAIFIGGCFKEADTVNWLKNQDALDQVPERRAAIENTEEEHRMDLIYHRSRISIPIYHVGGWYDIFSVGTQGNFAYLQNQGAEGARGKQKLKMGPFGHGNLKGLSYKDGGSLLGALKDEIRWFDYHLKGEDNGIMSEPPVQYYQMAGAQKKAFSDKNSWQTAANWPLEATPKTYYLTNPHGLVTEKPTAAGSATTYAYDPAKPVPTIGGANLSLDIGPLDQREVGEREDYLRIQTAPLAEDLKIAGPVYVDLYCSTDAPDTDFMVKLVDVYPDGYEALLLDAPVRTRYREGREAGQVKMMEPGKPTQIRVNLGGTANTFEAGHRIAVHITSSNAPRFEVNPNTGEAPGSNKLPPKVAHNTIHHDADHPTALVLPVVE
ncbi:MAG: CocE/NonD family hydrolase [Pirellulales bacterium]|nr:CocE/NonD family hydrolase [Pirellulales bacterium]